MRNKTSVPTTIQWFWVLEEHLSICRSVSVTAVALVLAALLTMLIQCLQKTPPKNKTKTKHGLCFQSVVCYNNQIKCKQSGHL